MRALGSGRVGLHSGEISSMASLLDRISAPFDVNLPFSTSSKNSYSTYVPHFSQTRRSVHTTTKTTFAADSGQTVAEQFDLLPPDTGIVRIEG